MRSDLCPGSSFRIGPYWFLPQSRTHKKDLVNLSAVFDSVPTAKRRDCAQTDVGFLDLQYRSCHPERLPTRDSRYGQVGSLNAFC